MDQQDCLKILFSCMRQKNPVPTPVEYHQELRSVGQFLLTVKPRSYQEDDNSFLADFLDTKKTFPSPGFRVEELMTLQLTSQKTELCSLLSYIITVNKVIRYSSICDESLNAIKHNDESPEGEHSILLKLKVFKSGALCWSLQDAFDLVQQIKELFQTTDTSSCVKIVLSSDGYLKSKSQMKRTSRTSKDKQHLDLQQADPDKIP